MDILFIIGVVLFVGFVWTTVSALRAERIEPECFLPTHCWVQLSRWEFWKDRYLQGGKKLIHLNQYFENHGICPCGDGQDDEHDCINYIIMDGFDGVKALAASIAGADVNNDDDEDLIDDVGYELTAYLAYFGAGSVQSLVDLDYIALNAHYKGINNFRHLRMWMKKIMENKEKIQIDNPWFHHDRILAMAISQTVVQKSSNEYS